MFPCFLLLHLPLFTFHSILLHFFLYVGLFVSSIWYVWWSVNTGTEKSREPIHGLLKSGGLASTEPWVALSSACQVTWLIRLVMLIPVSSDVGERVVMVSGGNIVNISILYITPDFHWTGALYSAHLCGVNACLENPEKYMSHVSLHGNLIWEQLLVCRYSCTMMCHAPKKHCFSPFW